MSARSEQEFQNLGRRLDLALDASQIGVWEHDLGENEARWDARMHRLYGTDEPMGTGVVDGTVWAKAIHPEDRARAEKEFADAIARKGAYSSQYRIILPNGEIRHLRSRAHYFGEGGNARFIGAEWDVTADVELSRELQLQKSMAETRAVELEATAAQVAYVADHDYLTGLANRRLFDRRLVELAQDTADRTMAILHIDLDGFKRVNDMAGHAAGDRVLKASTQLIRDTVGQDAFVARLGGDEFAIVLLNFGTPEDLEAIAGKLVRQLAQTVWHKDEALPITASIGVSSTAGRDMSHLLAESDIALHRAKTLGRGRAEIFSLQLKAQLARERRFATQFTRGLHRGELVPFYQAQVDAGTRRIVGVEALARWRHPKRGLLLPADFLPTATGLGMMDDLDAAMLKTALSDREDWTRRGVVIPRVAVNVSAARLSDPTLIGQLQRLAIEPGTVCFELLETIFFDDVEDGVLSNILALKDMGIDIEIDDFGSGHASIIGLVKLRPKRLKIDRRLVLPITTSREQKQLVRSIVDIAKALKIDVIAEGVETPEHAKLLTRIGCDILQGYGIAYPVSSEELVAAMLAEQDVSAVAPT